MNLKAAVIRDETKFPELVHKEAHTWTCRADQPGNTLQVTPTMPVAMMIVQEVGESLLTNIESGVAAHWLASGFRHRQAKARYLREPPVLSRASTVHSALHC